MKPTKRIEQIKNQTKEDDEIPQPGVVSVFLGVEGRLEVAHHSETQNQQLSCRTPL
jgi:hypothetical protein